MDGRNDVNPFYGTTGCGQLGRYCDSSGMMKLYGLDKLTKDQFEQYRLNYSPLGSVASIYLWEISFE